MTATSFCRALSLTLSAALTFADSATMLVKQTGTDMLDPHANPGYGVLKWSHGAFIYTDSESVPGPSLYVLNADGEVIAHGALRIPDTERIYVHAFDRATDGTVVFSGDAWSSGHRLPFLAYFSPDGQTQKTIRTGRYSASELAIAPDGTVWTLGCDWQAPSEVDPPPVDPETPVLQQFDRGGKVMAFAWPQSGFSRKELARIGHGKLTAARDRLGWYSDIAGETRYVEISTGTISRQAFPGLPAKYSNKRWDVDGFALTDSGQAVISVYDDSVNARGTYRFDRRTSQWMPLEVPPLGGHKFTPLLVGNDGENLVFHSGTSAAFFSFPN